MAYVGRGLTTGANYQKLDTISIDDATTFTMQVNSTAVTPAAEHVILAVNGVIQEPNVGFTVSGSTCTLASAIDNDGGSDTIWGVIAGNAAYVNNEFNTESFDVLSSTTSKPVFTLKNTNNGGTSAELRFNNTEAGGAGADGDDLGRVTFYGQDDGSNNQQFGEILCEISDASAGAEGGKMSLGVASHDGEMGNYGLIMTDGSAEDEIDVTIGSGTSSVTTIAGDLSVTGAGQGWVKVAEVDASSDATVTITFSTGDTYKTMMCVFRDIVHETDAQDAYVRLIVGGVTQTSDYSHYIHKRNPATNTYNHNEHTSGTFILYGEGFGTASGEKANGMFYWYHPAATDTQKHIHGHCLAAGSADNTLDCTFSGGYDGAETALTGFVFHAQNDNIMSGTYTIYGLSTS